MENWGKCLGYTNTHCPNCGRYRLELYENNKRVCEKCNWCIENESYVDVFAEYKEQVWNEYYNTYGLFN